MRACKRAAHGAALFYVLTALPVLACPTAADLSGPGVRFVGADGFDVVHRRVDDLRVAIDYGDATAPQDGASRSILVHGVYLNWLGDVDGQGRVVDGTAVVFGPSVALAALPVPAPGLTWTGRHVVSEGGASYTEQLSLTAGAPTEWPVGECRFNGLPVTMTTVSDDGYTYTEQMMYLPGLQTAVLVEFTDAEGSTSYPYTRTQVEGAPVPVSPDVAPAAPVEPAK